MCCFKAFNVGGIFSTALPPVANRVLLAKLTLRASIVEPGIYLKGIANYHCSLFSSRMSNAQNFNQISDQNALFLMERGAVGRIIFVVFWLLDSLGLERTRKWFVTDIMYLKMRNAEYWSENDSIGE